MSRLVKYPRSIYEGKKPRMAEPRRLTQAFQKAARKTRKKLTVAFTSLLLLTASCGTGPEKPTPERDAHTPVVSVAINAATPLPAGLRADSATVALFARNALRPANDNLTAEERMQVYMDQLCFRSGDDTAPHQNNIKVALEKLQELPAMGAPLVRYAADNNIQFCSLPDMPAGVGAQYDPRLKAVMSANADSPETMILRIAHEIFHARQDGVDLLNYYYSWDIDSRAARNLTIEAAAVTGELLLAFEAKQNGDPAIWNHIRERFSDGVYADAMIYDRIESSFAHVKTLGGTDMEAYAFAGRAAFERVFEIESWRDFYLNFELMSYVRDITSGKLDDARRMTSNGFSSEKAALSGRIGAGDVSFTAGARRPGLNSLLAQNEKMKWAYEATELERYRRVYGAHAAQTQHHRAAYIRGGNPYLGLDLAAVLEDARTAAFPAAEGKKKFGYLYEYMDAALEKTANTNKLSAAPRHLHRPPAA